MKKGVLAALQLIFFQCLTFALVSEPTRLHEGEALLERQEIERISKCVDNGRVVLGCRGVGLFSEFFGALNWLTWSERESIALKVFWGGEQFLYSNDEENHWHDFFWPFWGEATFSDIEKIAYFYWARRSMVVFLRRGYAFNFYRATGCDLVKRYIRVKSDIIEEVDAFCRDFFLDKDVIAVHLRSAEKDREGKQVSPDQMIKLANRLKRSDTVFYVLTDSEEYLEYARQNLEGPVVATSSMRVDNTVEGVHEKYAGNICLAREAIVDALIASRANTFIFTTSNLGFAVLVFNPDLRGISLRYNKAGEIECYDYAKSTDRDIFPVTIDAIV